MNLQQLRYLRETVRRDLNLTAASAALHTSQPGVSKAIRELEDELGVVIFVRKGKRLTQLTDAGRQVVAIAQRVLVEIDNLRQSADDFKDAEAGELRLAATHTQARHTLPQAIASLRLRYPHVLFRLHQGSPSQITAMLRAGTVDLGVATESIGSQPDLHSEALFHWYHCAIALPTHPLAALQQVDLEQLGAHDLITYDAEFAGRGGIDRAFAEQGIEPRIVLEATDSDVIKTYVRMGLGVGIVSELAMVEPTSNGPSMPATEGFVRLPIGRPFPRNCTRVAMLRGRILRGFERELIRLLQLPPAGSCTSGGTTNAAIDKATARAAEESANEGGDGSGGAIARGEGSAIARGEGSAIARGEGSAIARGEGSAIARGEGSALTGSD